MRRPARVLWRAGPVDFDAGPVDFDDAFRIYARYVGRIAYRLTGQHEDAEEITQEVFLRLSDRMDQVQSDLHLRRWLSMVTVRVAQRYNERFRFWRRLRVQGPDVANMGSGQGLVLGQASLQASPQASPEQRAAVAELFRTLATLPFGQRTAWVLAHGEGMTLDEIAAACQVSKATVKRRLTAARDAVRRHHA